MGLVLGGALLGELVLAGRLHVSGGLLTVTDTVRPADWLAHRIRDEIAVELRRAQTTPGGSGHDAVRTVRAWLAYLGRDAREQIGERLHRAGQAHPIQSRWPRRRITLYVPADINTAAWPGARLRTALTRGETLTTADVVLVGLIRAGGLHRQVLTDVPLAYLDRLLTGLPGPLREVVGRTTAAVGEAALAHRS